MVIKIQIPNENQKPVAVKNIRVEHAVLIHLPAFSDTMEEGIISEWYKKLADQVTKGEPLLEIESDKAAFSFESPEEGTLLYIAAGEGSSILVNNLLCIIGTAVKD